MEIILIILTSTIIATALCSAYYLGYRKGKEKQEENVYKVDNLDALKELVEWQQYDGRKSR